MNNIFQDADSLKQFHLDSHPAALFHQNSAESIQEAMAANFSFCSYNVLAQGP